MSRYESPGQVALLFAGATLASLLLIVLFTAEAKNRRTSRDLEIEDGGMLASLRQQMSRLAVGLRGTVGSSGLHRLSSMGGLARKRRSLGGGHRDYPGTGQEVSRGPEDDADQTVPPVPSSRPRHGLRHRHRQRQHARHRERTSPTSSSTTPSSALTTSSSSNPTSDPSLSPGEENSVEEGGGSRWLAGGGPQEEERAEGGSSAEASPTEESVDVSSSPRDGHSACYGPDQVVLIIALTCALNFACIFLVMALVHICNRNRKCASSGCDSPLLLVDSDYEVDPKACLVSSADEDDDYDDDVEVDALLLAKRPSAASLFAPFLPPSFPPTSIKHPPPWRPSSHPSAASEASSAASLGPLVGSSGGGVGGCVGGGSAGERRRCGALASSSSSNVVAASSACSSASRPLLPPAAFSMEDLHILE